MLKDELRGRGRSYTTHLRTFISCTLCVYIYIHLHSSIPKKMNVPNKDTLFIRSPVTCSLSFSWLYLFFISTAFLVVWSSAKLVSTKSRANVIFKDKESFHLKSGLMITLLLQIIFLFCLYSTLFKFVFGKLFLSWW